MSRFLLYTLAGIALFSVGLHALVARDHLLRKIIALNVMSSAVFLFLVALAYRSRPDAPDPLPHAMVLTGIVVAVSASALALGLLRAIHAASGRTTFAEEEGLE